MNVRPIIEDDFLETCHGIVEERLPSSLRFAPRATGCKYVVPMGYGTHPRAGAQLKVDEDSIRTAGAKLFYASVDERAWQLHTTTFPSPPNIGIAATPGE